MKCPVCNSETGVKETRAPIRRRYCLSCDHRFMTIETLHVEERKERKPPAPRVEKAPRVEVAKKALKKRGEARRRIEEMNEERAARRYNDNWYDEDNNFLPDRW
jgi:transcriptional regulator NrdR family protein